LPAILKGQSFVYNKSRQPETNMQPSTNPERTALSVLRKLWATTAGKACIVFVGLLLVGAVSLGTYKLTSNSSSPEAPGQTAEENDDDKTESGDSKTTTEAEKKAEEEKAEEAAKKEAAKTDAGVSKNTEDGNSTGGSGAGTGGSGSGGGSACAGTTSHIPDGPDNNGGCWPGPSNTGVPTGIVLGAYSGPSTITTPGTVIDSKTVNADLVIQTTGVIIRKSLVNGRIDVDGPYSLTIEDSEVDSGGWTNATIGFNGITMRRVEVRGGQTSVICGTDCVVEDSWLHDQFITVGIGQHLGGYMSNGGDNVTVRHNSIVCDVPDDSSGGGCSGSAQIYGDFANNTNFTFDRNLFMETPGGYCTSFGHNPGKPFGDNPANIIVTNNIWQRGSSGICAVFGATTSFLQANGNSWSNNKYDDGIALNP
jgi:hypothetical protein